MSGIIKKLKPKAPTIDRSVTQRISENEKAAKAEADKRNAALQQRLTRKSPRAQLMDTTVSDPFGAEGRMTTTRLLGGSGRNPRG